MRTAHFDVSHDEELQVFYNLGLARAPETPGQTPLVEDSGAPTASQDSPTTPVVETLGPVEASHEGQQGTGGIMNRVWTFMLHNTDSNIISPKSSRDPIHKDALIVSDISESQFGDCSKFVGSAAETKISSLSESGRRFEKGDHKDTSYSQLGGCSNPPDSPLNAFEVEDRLLADLGKRAAAFGADILKLGCTLQQSRDKITSLLSHICHNETEIAFLRGKEQKLCESIAHLESTQVTKTVDFEKTISELNTELRQLRVDLSEAKTAREEATSEFREATDSFSHERTKLDEQLENLRKESWSKDASIRRVEECAQMEKLEMEKAYLALDLKHTNIADSLSHERMKLNEQLENLSKESWSKDASIRKVQECAQMEKLEVEKAYLALDLQHTNIEQLLKSATEEVKMKKLEIENMQAHIFKMQQAYEKVENKNTKIEQQLSEMLADRDGSYADGLLTPHLLESTAKELFSSIGRFCRLYSQHIKTTRNVMPLRHKAFDDLLKTPVHLARPAHSTVFLTKAWVSHVLFSGFETEGFDRPKDKNTDSPVFRGDEERLRICSEYAQKSANRDDTSQLDSLFESYFCSRLSDLMADDLMPLLKNFYANGERANGQSAADDVKLKLLQSLVTAARKTWDFHKLCLSFKNPATIFRVNKDDAYDASYMDCSVGLDEDPAFVPKVGFMVFPGFQLRKSVMKCEIYFGTEEVM